VSDQAGVTSDSPAVPFLSLVIPAYNEAKNLPGTLLTAWSYLSSRDYAFQLLVVDDGSEDTTADVVREFAGTHTNVCLLSIAHGGKAAALRAGMLSASGELIVFSDADLATPLDYLDGFIEAIDTGCDVVIGSREGAGARRIGEPKYRHIMGRGFNLLVRALVLPGIQDSQCGFKLFKRNVAMEILRRSQLYRDTDKTIQGARVTAFDVELLVIARRLGYRICKFSVVWTYGKGSKVNPIRDTWANLIDVLTVKLNDVRGCYR
jgi:glycosyltransferase involved in cell wall biosynthesis